MRVLVTGASGFIGGPACAALAARGHEVVALVRRPGSEPPGTRAVRGDLTDRASLEREFATSCCTWQRRTARSAARRGCARRTSAGSRT